MATKNPLNKKIVLNNNHIISDWFYMNENPITPSDIKSSLSNILDIKIECWQEAGILEILLNSGTSIDFELSEPKFQDHEDNQFLISRNIQTLYYVAFNQDDYEKVTDIFKIIIAANKGLFCADSANFEPIIN